MIYMDSKSANDGTYNLTVTFDVGTNQDLAAVDVQNRVAIAQTSLPQDVIRQGVQIRKQSTDFLEVMALTSPKRTYDNVFLSNYALLNLQDALARVNGVGFVRIFGARDYSMRIWLDPDKMARLGSPPATLQRVIQEQNVVAPAGRVGLPPTPAGQQMQYSVFVQGRLADVKQYENMVVRAAANGQIVRLKDVARIELAGVDYSINVDGGRPPGGLHRRLSCRRTPMRSTWRSTSSSTMDMLAQSFPPDMRYSIPYSTTPFVTESLKEVVNTLGDGDPAGAAGGLRVPAELARDADPDAGGAGVADRHLRRVRRARLLDQHADAVRHGARDRHRGRRRDRGGRGGPAQARQRASVADRTPPRRRWRTSARR